MTDATTGARSTTVQPGALDDAGLRQVVTVLSTVQIVSWGILYYAFAALQSSITTDTGWSSVAVTGAFSLALVRLRRRRDLGRPAHRRGRPPRGDDRGLARRHPRCRDRRPGTEPGRVLPRLGAGRGRDGRHPVPARVRRPDPVGWVPPGAGADHADPGRRPGQHRVRAAGLRARRLARLARRLPGAPGRVGPHHGPAALVGPGPPLAACPRASSRTVRRTAAARCGPSRAARRSCC